MNGERFRQSGNWWFAVVVSLPLVLGAMLLFSLRRSPEDTSTPVRQPDPLIESPVGLTRLAQEEEGNLVAAEAHYLDPTPLFLPTEWNAGQNILPSNILRDPGQMFQDYPSRLVYAEEGLDLRFPDHMQVPVKSEDTIAIISDRTQFQGVGRGDVEPAKLAARSGYVEISLINTGERVLAQPVPDAVVPDGNWRPMELMGAVDAAGLVGRLAFVQSSGVVEVDAFYRDYLEETLLIGTRLKPGFYRFSVGP
jgi:hypothetical protein